MKKIFIILTAVVLFTSCNKDNDTDNPTNYSYRTDNKPSSEIIEDCKKYSYGMLNIDNKSSNPYDIYVNSVYVTVVNGNEKKMIAIKIGTKVVRVVQKSGYLLYPSEREYNYNIYQCIHYNLTIPPSTFND